MKIIVKDKDDDKKIKYPYIGIGENGLIVLFKACQRGVALVVPSNLFNIYKVGYYSERWEMSKFKPFEGSITLSND